mmetsp:Transcript_37984/g.63105  ORF Transcript_37984/g.63105 Transcript_37984/m.63105 type:complete len:256 (-) Transcript_37984:371-1138(-)
MADINDIGTGLCNCQSDPSKTSRFVVNNDTESDKTTLVGKPSLNYPANHRRINISSAQRNNDLLALKLRQFTTQDCGNSDRATSFHHHLLRLHQVQDSACHIILADKDNFVHVLADNLKRVCPNHRYSEAVCQSWLHVCLDRLPGSQGGSETGCVLGFDTNDLDRGAQGLGRHGNSCNKTTASNRNNDVVGPRNLTDHFDATSPSSCDNIWVIETIYVRVSLFFDNLDGMLIGFSNVISVQHDICTILPAVVDLR